MVDPSPMAQPVCFTCGMAVGEPHKLNRLDNGQICPTCRDRVLDSLPSILPDLRGVRGHVEFSPSETPDDFDGPPAAS
jgi:hypothetical protein